MEKSKGIGQLLKELDDMQKQFADLNDELIISKSKRKNNKVITDLASDTIDSDFFKIPTAPIRKTKNRTPNKNKVEKQTDLLFSLDKSFNTKKKSDKSKSSDNKEVEKLNTSKSKVNVDKEIFFDKPQSNDDYKNIKKTEVSIPEISIDNNSLKKITPVKKANTDKKNELKPKLNNENSYLSIKQKLDKIKNEITLREKEILIEKGKVASKEKSSKEIAEKALITTVKKVPLKSEKKSKSTEKTPKKNKKLKKIKAAKKLVESKNNSSVDILTIIILVLVIVLIITAWYFLK